MLDAEELFKKGWPQILPHMDERPDQHVARFLGVEDVVRLKAKATVAGHKFIGTRSDPGKLSQQIKGALETRMVGFGLIAAERASENA